MLSFWAEAYAQGFALDTGALSFGSSSSNSSQGTVVFSATPLAGGWQQFTTTFVAPNNGAFLTVVQENTGDIWNHLDDISLVDAGPAVPTSYCTCGTTSNSCCALISANDNPSVS